MGERIRAVAEALRELGYTVEEPSEEEFSEYMSGETPTGDRTTLEDVLANDFLMVHEVVELSELKKMGVQVGRDTVVEHYPEVYRAHLVALKYELTYALRKGALEWFWRRLPAVSVEEPWLPREFSHLKGRLEPLCSSIRRRLLKLLEEKYGRLRRPKDIPE